MVDRCSLAEAMAEVDGQAMRRKSPQLKPPASLAWALDRLLECPQEGSEPRAVGGINTGPFNHALDHMICK